MTFTAPLTASVGGTITATYVNTLRDNDYWFNDLLPSPTQANQVLRSSSGTTATWGWIDADHIANGAIMEGHIAPGHVTSTKLADASVTLDKLISSYHGLMVPANSIGYVANESSIPSGWARETDLNGRFAIGAGTLSSVTWAELTSYGSSWAHDHTFSGTTGDPDATIGKLGISPTAAAISTTTHGHAYSGTVSALTWYVPSICYVAVKKS